MATNFPRALSNKLTGFHGRFADEFGRSEARQHSLVYLKGLILGEGRKSVERIALRFAPGRNDEPPSQNEVIALQEFLTSSPWDYVKLQRIVQSVFAEELVSTTSQWPLGIVGVVDESSFVKSGSESCGVKRQWCGRLGKKENCQVGVFLVGVTPAGSALLDHQLYLPNDWASDRRRRRKTRVPKEVTFQTKPEIAASLIGRTLDAQHVQFDWVTADEGYGRDGAFLDALEARNLRYVVEVPVNTTVKLCGPSHPISVGEDQGLRDLQLSKTDVMSVQALASELPADAWHTYQLREGAKGPLVFEFAFVRVWAVRHRKLGPPQWVIIRRSLGAKPEMKYYVSNADGNTPTEHMALVTGTRWRVEEFLEDGKGDFGMADYEARAWTSWHHHMTLVSIAHLFITVNRHELKQDIPELTLPMAMRLIQAALEQPRLTKEDAIRLTEYHLARNKTARESHRNSWLRRHKGIRPKRLL
jgi:SRSO17 transposase